MKPCNYCKEKLNYDKYHTNKSTMDGYSNRCKECTSKIRSEKRAAKKALEPKKEPKVVTQYKECKSCNVVFNLSRFNKCKLTKDGREGTCRVCRQENREKNARARMLSGIIKTEKHCSKCKKILLINDFSKDKSRDDGFSAICKMCKSETYKEYSKNPNARESARRRTATWKKENPDKVREQYQRTKARKIKSTTKYHNSKKGVPVTLKAQAKQRGIVYNLTSEFVNSHWNSDCNYCRVKLDKPRFDRIDSSKGYTEDNVTPCCSLCNYTKASLSVNNLKAHLEKMLSNKENW